MKWVQHAVKEKSFNATLKCPSCSHECNHMIKILDNDTASLFMKSCNEFWKRKEFLYRNERITKRVLSNNKERFDLMCALHDPRMCPECSFGPLVNENCDNMVTHSDQFHNACPSCMFFSNNWQDYPPWDGNMWDQKKECPTQRVGKLFCYNPFIPIAVGRTIVTPDKTHVGVVSNISDATATVSCVNLISLERSVKTFPALQLYTVPPPLGRLDGVITWPNFRDASIPEIDGHPVVCIEDHFTVGAGESKQNIASEILGHTGEWVQNSTTRCSAACCHGPTRISAHHWSCCGSTQKLGICLCAFNTDVSLEVRSYPEICVENQGEFCKFMDERRAMWHGAIRLLVMVATFQSTAFCGESTKNQWWCT